MATEHHEQWVQEYPVEENKQRRNITELLMTPIPHAGTIYTHLGAFGIGLGVATGIITHEYDNAAWLTSIGVYIGAIGLLVNRPE